MKIEVIYVNVNQMCQPNQMCNSVQYYRDRCTQYSVLRTRQACKACFSDVRNGRVHYQPLGAPITVVCGASALRACTGRMRQKWCTRALAPQTTVIDAQSGWE